MYLLESLVQVRAALGVRDERVAARLRVVGEIPLRLDDHQVDFDGQSRRASNRLQDHTSAGEIRHETAVHHITMNQVGAGGSRFGDLLAETGKIRREDGRRDSQRAWHRQQLYPVGGQISRVMSSGHLACCYGFPKTSV